MSKRCLRITRGLSGLKPHRKIAIKQIAELLNFGFKFSLQSPLQFVVHGWSGPLNEVPSGERARDINAQLAGENPTDNLEKPGRPCQNPLQSRDADVEVCVSCSSYWSQGGADI